MDKLNEAVIMNEEFLSRFNKAIDRINKQKENAQIDYADLEKVLRTIMKIKKPRRTSKIKTIAPIKREELISYALDFFKSIDEELYRQAIDIILQHKKMTKMNIYNKHEIRNFDEKDENGMKKYTNEGMHSMRNEYTFIHIPLQKQLKPREAKILEKNSGTLEDVATLVHEISHDFDKSDVNTLSTREYLLNVKKKVQFTEGYLFLSESTAIAFEQMLVNYLGKKNIFSADVLKEYDNWMSNCILDHVYSVYYKLLFAREKSDNGKVTLAFVEEFIKNEKKSVQYMRWLANGFIDDNGDILEYNKYAISALISPTIVKKYDEGDITAIKQYLQASSNNDLKGALKALGIEYNQQGLEILIKNMKEQETKALEDRER